MDWRSAGYWPVYKDGKKVWIPKDKVQEEMSFSILAKIEDTNQ
jgi:hypothetical protein